METCTSASMTAKFLEANDCFHEAIILSKPHYRLFLRTVQGGCWVDQAGETS